MTMIIEGSAIEETIDSLISASMIFGVKEETPILIVEGKNDKELLQRYYYFHKDGEIPFKVVTGEDFGHKVNGKRNALESYSQAKEYFEKVFVLIDRDYDYYLGEYNFEDNNIFYYDYFELENYLFDDTILKIFLDKFFNCMETELYERIKIELNKNKEVYYPYAKIGFFREMLYRERVNINLSTDQVERIVNTVARNPNSIFQDLSEVYGELGMKEKIRRYFFNEFEKVDLSYEEVISSIEIDENAAGILEVDPENEDQLFFYKYLISGKLILNSLQTLIENFEGFGLKANSSSRRLDLLITTEWIPLYSEDFKGIINRIENQI